MFYTYRQNNSFGRWNGPIWVIVEADSPAVADVWAEMHAGVYFNGCSNGRDCTCCGDRWYRAYKGDETEIPEICGQPIDSYKPIYGEEDCLIVYRDGTKREVVFRSKTEV